jgi:hypothetical protein
MPGIAWCMRPKSWSNLLHHVYLYTAVNKQSLPGRICALASNQHCNSQHTMCATHRFPRLQTLRS